MASPGVSVSSRLAPLAEEKQLTIVLSCMPWHAEHGGISRGSGRMAHFATPSSSLGELRSDDGRRRSLCWRRRGWLVQCTTCVFVCERQRQWVGYCVTTVFLAPSLRSSGNINIGQGKGSPGCCFLMFVLLLGPLLYARPPITAALAATHNPCYKEQCHGDDGRWS